MLSIKNIVYNEIKSKRRLKMLNKIKEFSKKPIVQDFAIALMQGAVIAVAGVTTLIVISATIGIMMRNNPNITTNIHSD